MNSIQHNFQESFNTENKIWLPSKYSTCLHDFKVSQYQVEKHQTLWQFKYHPKTPPQKEYLERYGALVNLNIYS